MSTRRDLITTAALEVLAEGGPRALTHRAVDRAAGLALGSTANLFSTRSALLAGVVAELERRDLESFERLADGGRPRGVDSLAETFTALAVASTEPQALAPTRARLSLMLAHPELFTTSHARVVESLAGTIRDAGIPAAEAVAARLAAYLDGVATHVVVTGASPAVGDLRTAIRALLRAERLE